MASEKYSLGLDFGTDSVRALIVDVATGEEVASGVHGYIRWRDGLFCDSARDRYRQHPLDHIEGIVASVRKALESAKQLTGDDSISAKIIGIGVDATGSSPMPLDKNVAPLALHSELADNPDAMVFLWKDHTAVAEAEEINEKSRSTGADVTRYCGGIYSSEWFWSKILRAMRSADERLISNIRTWVEHSDWIPALLTGVTDAALIKRNRCGAGHKALWHDSWKLPFEFLSKVDKRFAGLNGQFYSETFTSDTIAGGLSQEWADNLQLSKGIPVAVGIIDAHAGAIGNGIKPGMLSRVIGTSTCDMVVAPYELMRASTGEEKLIEGICGQVDGSIIPGMFGLEAGQSAVGDIFANFRDWIADSVFELGLIDSAGLENLKDKIYSMLTIKAEKLRPDELPLVIDYHNGRRTPDADQRLTGAALGLTLGTDAAKYFAGLVQGSCYSARLIMETFIKQGIPVEQVIACGGIADKSGYIMQTMADAMNVEIKIAASSQACALGAAILGAVVGGAYKTVREAQDKMASGFKAVYQPRKDFAEMHNRRYKQFTSTAVNLVPLLRTFR